MGDDERVEVGLDVMEWEAVRDSVTEGVGDLEGETLWETVEDGDCEGEMEGDAVFSGVGVADSVGVWQAT